MKNQMDHTDDNKMDAVFLRIVKEFGNGELLSDKYLFEQITRLPEGYTAHRMRVTEAVATIGEHNVLVFLDTHPNNRKHAKEVSKQIGSEGAFEFQLSKNEVSDVLRFDNCDMYVTTLEGRLLIVGCHEDAVVDGEREVWVPVMGNESR
jgi:hypothetical protein